MTSPKDAFEPGAEKNVRNDPNGLLAALARAIWDARKITYTQFKELLSQFTLSTHRGVADPVLRARRQNTDMGNHIRAIANDRMTWGVFIMMLKVIKAKRVSIRLDVEFTDGTEVKVTKDVKFTNED